MMVTKLYQENNSRRRLLPLFMFKSRGTNRTSYQGREPIEEDEDKFSMNRRDMPPPLPQRVANPRTRIDQVLQEFHSISDRMHRATWYDAFTHAWSDYSRSVLPQSMRKTCTNVELLKCQRTSVASSSTIWVPSNRRMSSKNQRT